MRPNMTKLQDFYRKDCEKIDPWLVNAYVELKLDDLNPTGLLLDSSWGESRVDLTDIVKAAETLTYLKLSPADTPEYLEYDGEDGIPQCIHGDDLSRIISLQLLKDVEQNIELQSGDVFVYDAQSKLFKRYNISSVIGDINNLLQNINQRLTAIENKLIKPTGVPNDATITWGNINLYSDNTNTNLKTSGLYTHNPATDKTNDEYFA